jgi:hypothetical protein
MKRLVGLFLIQSRRFRTKQRRCKLNSNHNLKEDQMDNLSPRNRMLHHSSALLRWLHSPEGVAFNEWITDVRLRENKKLMESEELPLVFRAQGSVGVCDLVLSLEDDLLQYELDVKEGRIKPLKEVASA